jgi:hypothetical protein
MIVSRDKAARVGAFLWRYQMARHRCMGEQPRPEDQLAVEVEQGIQRFGGEIIIEARLWPPVTNDAKHQDFFRAIVLLDDLAMPELVDLAGWRDFVHDNRVMPERREQPDDLEMHSALH